MKRRIRIALVLLASLGAFILPEVVMASSAGTEDAQVGSAKVWVCPPCGDPHDEMLFEGPGSCPVCGMTLVEQQEAPRPTKVAILLFDGVQIIDYTGPYEVFGQADFEVFTVSDTGEPIVTTMGMTVTPTHSFESSPAAELLLIPGGHVHEVQHDERWLSWVRQAVAGADHVLSVCNGAFILAEAGLLDGKTATTFHRLFDEFERAFPKVQLVRDQRYTDNGKILTSAGLSSGIDAALFLVSKVKGETAARSLALHLEYPWDPEGGFVRGVLADRHLAALDEAFELPPGTSIQQTSSVGDRDRWEAGFTATTDRTEERFLELFARAASKIPTWTRLASSPASAAMAWTVTTPSDGEWTATLRVVSGAGSGRFEGKLALERARAVARSAN